MVQSTVEASNPSDLETAEARIQQLLLEVEKFETLATSLQNKLDHSEVDCHELEDKIALNELENLKNCIILPPFVIFSTIPIPLPTISNNGPTPERLRVKITSSSPKIINPATPQTRPAIRCSTPAVSRRSEPILPLREPPPTSETPPSKTEPLAIPTPNPTPDHPSPRQNPVVFERTVVKVRKQVQRVENLLELKVHELTDLRDRYLKMRLKLAEVSIEEQKVSQALRNANAANDRLKNQLNDSYTVINRRDAEIRRLTNLLREIDQRVRPVMVQRVVNRMTQDERENAVLKEYRRRVAQIEMGQPAIVISRPSMPPGLKSLLDRQTRAIELWNARKNVLLEQERAQMMAILRGMRLVIPLEGESEKVVEKPLVIQKPKIITVNQMTGEGGPLEITALLPPAWKTKVRIDPNRTFQMKMVPNEEADKGVVNAALANPKLPKSLMRGVVADPILI
jgi:hypothetical protein